MKQFLIAVALVAIAYGYYLDATGPRCGQVGGTCVSSPYAPVPGDQ